METARGAAAVSVHCRAGRNIHSLSRLVFLVRAEDLLPMVSDRDHERDSRLVVGVGLAEDFPKSCKITFVNNCSEKKNVHRLSHNYELLTVELILQNSLE